MDLAKSLSLTLTLAHTKQNGKTCDDHLPIAKNVNCIVCQLMNIGRHWWTVYAIKYTNSGFSQRFRNESLELR